MKTLDLKEENLPLVIKYGDLEYVIKKTKNGLQMIKKEY